MQFYSGVCHVVCLSHLFVPSVRYSLSFWCLWFWLPPVVSWPWGLRCCSGFQIPALRQPCGPGLRSVSPCAVRGLCCAPVWPLVLGLCPRAPGLRSGSCPAWGVLVAGGCAPCAAACLSGGRRLGHLGGPCLRSCSGVGLWLGRAVCGSCCPRCGSAWVLRFQVVRGVVRRARFCLGPGCGVRWPGCCGGLCPGP